MKQKKKSAKLAIPKAIVIPLVIALLAGVFKLALPFVQKYVNSRYKIILSPQVLSVEATDSIIKATTYYIVSYRGQNRTLSIPCIGVVIPEIDYRPLLFPANKKYHFSRDSIFIDSTSSFLSMPLTSAPITFRKLLFYYYEAGEQNKQQIENGKDYQLLSYNEFGDDSLPDSIIVKYGSRKEVKFRGNRYLIYYMPSTLKIADSVTADSIYLTSQASMDSLLLVGNKSDSTDVYMPNFVVPKQIRSRVVIPKDRYVSFIIDTKGNKFREIRKIEIAISRKGFIAFFR